MLDLHLARDVVEYPLPSKARVFKGTCHGKVNLWMLSQFGSSYCTALFSSKIIVLLTPFLIGFSGSVGASLN